MRRLGCERDTFFALAQRSILFEQIGDIHAGADIAAEVPARPITRHSLIGNPAVFSIMPPQTVLRGEGIARGENIAVALRCLVPIVRMDALPPAAPKFLLHGATGKLEPGFVEEGATLVFAGHPDQDRRGIGRGLKAFLAFRQRGLSPSPSDQVSHQTADQECLQKKDRDTGDDPRPVTLPDCRLAEQDRAARRQEFFIDLPSLELPPVVTRRQTRSMTYGRNAGCRFTMQNTNGDCGSFLSETVASSKGGHPRFPSPVDEQRGRSSERWRLDGAVAAPRPTSASPLRHREAAEEKDVGIWRQGGDPLLHLVEGKIVVVGELDPAGEGLGCLLKRFLPAMRSSDVAPSMIIDIVCRRRDLQHVLETSPECPIWWPM